MGTLYRPAALTWREERAAGLARFTTAPARLPGVPILLFAVFWNAIILAAIVASRGAVLIIGWLHLTAGAVMAYAAVQRLAGTSSITIDANALILAHRPFTFFGMREPVANLEGFDLAEVATSWWSPHRFVLSRARSGTTTVLRALTRDRRAVRMFLLDEDPEHLRFIASRLNEVLAEMREPVGYRDERALPPAA